MLRVVYMTIMLFIVYNKDSNLFCECQVTEKTVDIGRVLYKLKEVIGNIPSYVGMDKWFQNKTKQTFRDEFLRNVARGINVIKQSGKAIKQSNKKQYDDSTAPKRRYKKFGSGKSAIQLIKSHGYKAETHKIQTFDGYTLTIQRILTNTKVPANNVVILHHGILGSSEDWLLLGPGKGLPYLLSDQGYDVWLLNARGNKYSRYHEDLDTDSHDFWDFSWHEMGTHDLPATLTYISDNTRDANLYYIGHSMGATALFVLLATYPEYNQKLKLAILLAPLVFMGHAKGPLKYFGNYHSQSDSYIGYKRKDFLSNNVFPQSIVEMYCQGSKKSCMNPLLLLSNGGKDMPDPEMSYKILTHVPAGGSTKTLVHYMQLIRNGHFQMFDYGMLQNIKNYKTEYPPKYNLSSLTLPIVMFTSSSDWLSTEEDIAILLSKLRNIKTHDTLDNFDHLDFIWSKDAAYLLYYIMIDILDETASMKKMNNLVTTII